MCARDVSITSLHQSAPLDEELSKIIFVLDQHTGSSFFDDIPCMLQLGAKP
jgi:hypothetical protein